MVYSETLFCGSVNIIRQNHKYDTSRTKSENRVLQISYQTRGGCTERKFITFTYIHTYVALYHLSGDGNQSHEPFGVRNWRCNIRLGRRLPRRCYVAAATPSQSYPCWERAGCRWYLSDSVATVGSIFRARFPAASTVQLRRDRNNKLPSRTDYSPGIG